MPDSRFADDPSDPEEEAEALPRHLHIPSAIILAIIWPVWLLHFPHGMLDWGLSATSLAEGRYETIVLHMFAHGGLVHIGMNSAVLFSLGGLMLTYMGPAPSSWLRWFAFYFLSGFAGAGMFVVLNPGGGVPMVGASGAISGLIGMASRLRRDGQGLMPLASSELRLRIWDFVKANLFLIVLITVPIFLLGGEGGIAWEAHLGGFLVGIFCARFFIEPFYRGDAVNAEPED